MVTMMQYYTDYRPFIIKNYKNSNKVSNDNKASNQENTTVKTSTILPKSNLSKQNIMNKSINSEVIGYMRDVSTSVNLFKSAVNGLDSDIKLIKKYKTFDAQDEEVIEEDLTKLTDGISNLKNIIGRNKSKANVEKIEEFETRFSSMYDENKELFQKLGVSFEDGEFIKENPMDSDFFIENIDTYDEKIKDLKKATEEFSSSPMSSFVEFKTFKNYFNYSFKNKGFDSFKLIESGNLLNIAL